MDQDHEFADALEADQMTAATLRKLPRRQLGRATLVLLLLLRAYVLVAIPIVGYAFIHALAGRG